MFGPAVTPAAAPGAGRPTGTPGTALRVALIGHGSIGRVVARELTSGAVPGATLVALVNRSAVPAPPAPQTSLAEAIELSDVVVECAGAAALRSAAEPVLTAGRDLLVTSIGALLDEELRGRLHRLGPGRLRCTHGAVGGLDLLAAAASAGALHHVELRTTKRPVALVQPWMDGEERRRLDAATGDVLVFRGGPAEAARRFPQVLNVASAIALAVGDPDAVVVELHADPAAELTTHRIEARGPQGRYLFRIENRPSDDNPRTSAVVPYSVLQNLRGMTATPPLIA